MSPPSPSLKILPLTAARWDDFTALFGTNGACGGCWCMWFRASRPEYRAGTRNGGAGNRKAMKQIVAGAAIPPGLLAYDRKTAVGWCALAPRAEYTRLARSRILKPVDDRPVWAVSCFFVAKSHRRRGVTVALLKAADDFAKKHGATLLEGYPVDPGRDQPDAFAFPGLAGAFEKAGYREVARRSPSRPIMRRMVK
jgi:GNAT superfamily N-acetyltransferase